jgi:flagellar hook-basal body complex protein FliE
MMAVGQIGGMMHIPGAVSPSPVQPLARGTETAPGTGAPTPAGFGDMISQFLSEANSQQLAVGREVEALATGQTNDIHSVVLSVAKADLAFRFLMEIRNRLVSSYQEVMRMQV